MVAQQLSLFDAKKRPPRRSAALNRRASQAAAVLERLRRGPATARDLMAAANCLQPYQRVAELRAAGYVVECDKSKDPAVYTLRK